MKAPLYTMNGERLGDIDLPDAVFNIPMNKDLLMQNVRVLRANQRRRLAHTKDRGEVRGGGKKPWRQKGTGRARHGSIRSPLWRGGGTTFGPRKEHGFAKLLPDTMRRKGLAIALSAKVRDGEVLVLNRLDLAEPKTKHMVQALVRLTETAFGTPTGKHAGPARMMLVSADKNTNVSRAVRNLPYAQERRAANISVLDILSARYLFFPEDAVSIFAARIGKGVAARPEKSEQQKPRKQKRV